MEKWGFRAPNDLKRHPPEPIWATRGPLWIWAVFQDPLGRHFALFWLHFGLPWGTLLGAFSAPVSLWDALGTVKWESFGGIRFDITFLSKVRSKLDAFWTLKTLIICVRGCKNQVFSYVGFGTILGTILEVILELKMDPKSYCDSLWASSVAILTLFWGVEKSVEKRSGGNFQGHAEGQPVVPLKT